MKNVRIVSYGSTQNATVEVDPFDSQWHPVFRGELQKCVHIRNAYLAVGCEDKTDEVMQRTIEQLPRRRVIVYFFTADHHAWIDGKHTIKVVVMREPSEAGSGNRVVTSFRASHEGGTTVYRPPLDQADFAAIPPEIDSHVSAVIQTYFAGLNQGAKTVSIDL